MLSLRSVLFEDPFFGGAPEFLRLGFGDERDFPSLTHFDRQFDAMRRNMDRQFDAMRRNMDRVVREEQSSSGAEDGQHIVRQSVYSYCKDGDGAPRVYEAHSSTRSAAGGVRETRKAIRDSEHNVEKMEVAQHIGSRARKLHRERNTQTNETHETQRFEGLDDKSEAAHRAFDAEWQQLTREANEFWGRPFFAMDWAPAAAAGASALPAAAAAAEAEAAAAAAGSASQQQQQAAAASEGLSKHSAPTEAAPKQYAATEGEKQH